MWYYRPCKIIRKDGSFYWCVKEYYPDEKDGLGDFRSMNPEYPYGETKKELIRDLEMMLKDCKKRKNLIDYEM